MNTKPAVKQVKLDLVGVDGDAWAIMGTWRAQAYKEKWTGEEVRAVLDEAMSGDYDHLLATITKYCR